MTKYFVEVWEPLPNDEIKRDGGLTIDHHVVQIKYFLKLEDAWDWTLTSKIEKYTVYKAECIIDNT